MKHLVSHILSKVIKQIKDDWEHKYGHPVYLLETFVECVLKVPATGPQTGPVSEKLKDVVETTDTAP